MATPEPSREELAAQLETLSETARQSHDHTARLAEALAAVGAERDGWRRKAARAARRARELEVQLRDRDAILESMSASDSGGSHGQMLRGESSAGQGLSLRSAPDIASSRRNEGSLSRACRVDKSFFFFFFFSFLRH
jgi:hypothetical protein